MRRWLTGLLGDRLGLDPEYIDAGRPFETYGIDPLAALALADELGHEVGALLEPTAVWDHPTVGSLAHHLAREVVRARAALLGGPW